MIQQILSVTNKTGSSSRVILFGAGASYGSGHVAPSTPPLGNQLYLELKKRFPISWGSLPIELDKKFQNSFEEGMQEIWEKYSVNIGLLMRHMTLYLAQLRPDDSKKNLYIQFIEKLKSLSIIAGTIFSSLNYDLLLEIGASVNHLSNVYFGENSSTELFNVWKLHGSCNFIPQGIHAGSGIQYTAGITFNTGINPVDPNQAITFCLSGTALYPAMCLYMKSKQIQIGYGIINTMQQRWGEIVKNADKILVIGVNPYFDDKHVWDPLSQTEAKIGFIGSKKGYEQWTGSYRDASDTELIGNRWEESFDGGIKFLR